MWAPAATLVSSADLQQMCRAKQLLMKTSIFPRLYTFWALVLKEKKKKKGKYMKITKKWKIRETSFVIESLILINKHRLKPKLSKDVLQHEWFI